MCDRNFCTDNHYVPQSYLKGWTSSGNIWVYRILVPHSNYPLWAKKPPVSVASIKHLYTGIDNGEPTDELERWFEHEFETPAAPVIRKAIAGVKLATKDWHILVRFLAAQDLRTPRFYLEHTSQMDRILPGLMDETLKDSILKFSEAKKVGKPLPAISPQNYGDMPLRVTKDIEASKIGIEVLNGRGLWLWEVKRMLENTAKWLHMHQWTILSPPKRMSWLTSDNPVIHLGYTSPGDYTLGRAWAKSKMNIMLPLSPRHLLFTQVGDPAASQGTRMSNEQASLIRRVTAENAFRFIFAADRDPEVEKFRRRKIDTEAFQTERKEWLAWHNTQSDAQKDFESNSK